MIKLRDTARSVLRNKPFHTSSIPETVSVGGKVIQASASFYPNDSAYDVFRSHQITPVSLHEIHDPHAFHAAIKGSSNPFASSVEVKSPEELAKGRMFVNDQGTAGITLHGDYIGGAFNHDPEIKGFLHSAVPLMIQLGGRRADAFDTTLPHIYAQHGLHTVARVPFNDEYAPQNWDYGRYAKYNGGRPDVVVMSYQHNNFNDYKPTDGMNHRYGDFDMADAVSRNSVIEPKFKKLSQFRKK